MEQIIISNPQKFEELKSALKKGGADKLHILADFDRTLIKAFVNGEKITSIISILYNQNYLTKDYGLKAQELHKKYHAVEMDPRVSKQEKQKAMLEWWTLHFDLLIKSGLNKKDIAAIINSEKIKFREGFTEFVGFLRDKKIPVVIMSSAGLGRESIRMALQRDKMLDENIYIISNDFEWDKDGRAMAVKKPIIYNMNKSEIVVADFPQIFSQIKDRKNVLLLGDSLEDADMANGFKYENLIKIGFLNENVEESLSRYKEVFDVIITNDGTMDHINKLLKEIII